MKTPQVRGYTVLTIIGRDGPRYAVELWRQPLHLWLIHNAYHWYDMHVEKIPGLHRFEHWLMSQSDDVHYTPICARRDLRCYLLEQRRKDHIARFDIDRETADKLRGTRGALV
ncbi:MAG: hypothetical protein K0S78_4480 [Thermomicrobiales bacterium]|nr:hypothetical protein [Thermomicrobiales bacterium]